MSITVHHGDMLEVLPTLSARFHAVVTDPPYHLASIVKRFGADGAASAKVGQTGAYARASKGFMGKQWDGGDIAFRPETWAAVGSVMLPGAHLVAFAGTKGAHRMACAIEDAGFEIRDTLMWLYGSGFPKSHNVAKGIDKRRRRDFVNAAIDLGIPLPARSTDDWTKEDHAPGDKWWQVFKDGLPRETWSQIERQVIGRGKSGDSAWFARGAHDITDSATEEARVWEGWGTALKPAYEPIVLARWPMDRKTVAANVLAHGTGAINVDACRVGTDGGTKAVNHVKKDDGRLERWDEGYRGARNEIAPIEAGRWPANVVHDGSDEVVRAFPDTGPSTASPRHNGEFKSVAKGRDAPHTTYGHADSGSAARFFYSAKADAGDRLQSKHPTVKPVDLMRWLVRLVTPKGGLVLDPFAGSGTTGMACMAEGFDCHLIEREAEYAADIRRRIAHVSGADAPLFASVPA